ncbi:MAG TPA: type II toxin-antitoxin system RelE/ParE family toxin [Pyrinomonadaceae bacterium]
MADIIWSSPAFLALERLPQATSFGILRLLDGLSHSPRMGHSMDELELPGFRQLIYRRKNRIIYEYDEAQDCVRILALLDCRQQIPEPKDLKFRPPDEELPLE